MVPVLTCLSKRGWSALGCAVVFFAYAIPVHAFNYAIDGKILTSSDISKAGSFLPVPFVWVKVMERGYLWDTCWGEGWADSNAEFSISFESDSNPLQLSINVRGVAYLPDGKYVNLRDSWGIIEYPLTGIDRLCWPSAYPTLFGQMNLPDNKANILTEAGKALRFARDNQASGMGWAVPCDLDGYADDSGNVCNGSSIRIKAATYDADASADGYFSSIHHETGHFIAYQAYGGTWPPCPVKPSPHWFDTESCEGFAISEGWAEYFAFLSCPDAWSGNLTAVANSNMWRGADNMGDTNVSAVGMGEIVEGAVAKTWVDIGDFGKVFRTVAQGPNSFWEFIVKWGVLGYNRADIFPAAQPNGMIYSRGKIDGFAEGAPPNVGPSEVGNQKIIRTTTFLRGTVKPATSQVSKSALKLGASSSTIACDQKALGYKSVTTPEAPMMDQSLAAFSFLVNVAWENDISFQTSALGDGSYDLVAKVRNVYGWWDDFSPSFAGDSDTARDSNEKWLKHLQTWYSRETEPSDYKKGKVIIDNTPPEISNTFPPAN